MRYLLAPSISIIGLLIFGCQSDGLKSSADVDEYFTISEFTPKINESSTLILGTLVRDAGDNLILYNRVNKKFLLLQKDSSYSELGGSGHGPLEYGRFTGVYTTSNALYVHDLSDISIIRYPYDEESTGKEIFIGEQVIDMAVDEKSRRIMIYANKIDGENVLFLYDFDGNLIKSFYKPDNKNFKLFSYRFRYGNVEFKNGRFYFMYPDKNDLVELSTEGLIIDTLTFTDKSPFNSDVPEMPEYLNPFTMTKKHYKYISSYLNPSKFYFSKDELILFENVRVEYDSNIGNTKYVSFYNLLNRDGDVIFEGLEFGESMRLITILNNESLIMYDSDNDIHNEYFLKL